MSFPKRPKQGGVGVCCLCPLLSQASRHHRYSLPAENLICQKLEFHVRFWQEPCWNSWLFSHIFSSYLYHPTFFKLFEHPALTCPSFCMPYSSPPPSFFCYWHRRCQPLPSKHLFTLVVLDFPCSCNWFSLLPNHLSFGKLFFSQSVLFAS